MGHEERSLAGKPWSWFMRETGQRDLMIVGGAGGLTGRKEINVLAKCLRRCWNSFKAVGPRNGQNPQRPFLTSSVRNFSMSSVSSVGSSSRPKNHLCDYPGCDKAYSKPSLLEQHKRTHTGERPFKCTACDKTFLRKSHLQAHEISHQNPDSKPFHCSVCGKGVNTAQHLKRHEITHEKSFKCTHPGCDEAFYKHQTLRHHILSVHEKALTCHKCDKSFTRPYRLAQHNLKYHSETPTYHCDSKGCFKNFKTWSALQLHVKNDHPKIRCKICGKGCVGTHGLMSHMITHDESKKVKLWNCEYCNGNFVKKVQLIEHYNQFHDGNVPEHLVKPEISENPQGGISEFRMFDQESEDEEIEETSVAQSLKSLNDALDLGKSIFEILLGDTKTIPCPIKSCDRKFTKDHNLKLHLKTHQETFRKVLDFLASLKDNDNDNEEEINNMIDQELNSYNVY